jgi:hypothetical protein
VEFEGRVGGEVKDSFVYWIGLLFNTLNLKLETKASNSSLSTE